MKQTNDFLSELQNLDEQEAVKLLGAYPAVPDKRKDQLYKKVEQRMKRDLFSAGSEVTESFEVSEAPKKISFRSISATAACLLLIAGVSGGGIWMLANMGNDSPIDPKQEITTAESTQALMTETIEATNAPAVSDTSEELTQYEIYYRCMNTLEFLDRLSGNVTLRQSIRFDGITEGSFEFDFLSDQYHAVVSYEDAVPAASLKRTEHFNQAGHCFVLYDYMSERSSEYTEEFHGPTMEGMVWSDTANIYNTYGKDPTNVHELGACFIPQEKSLGYLENFDNWEIAEKVDWNGRVCYHIQGVGGEYGSGYDVDTFHIWVDQETGIWYQFEGYNAVGELTDYIYTENMQFGDAAKEVIAFSEEMAEGYEYHLLGMEPITDMEPNTGVVEMTKEEIYDRSMNTLLYLDQISGYVTIRGGCDFPLITEGIFAFDFENEAYQARVDFTSAIVPNVIVQENQYFTNGAHVDAFYNYTDDQYPDVYSALELESGLGKGESISSDPTYAHEFAGCFMPREMTEGYLKDFSKWEIVVEDQYNGRVCVIVEGTSEEYGSAFGVSRFRIFIDTETGVWLKYEGYDESGKLQDYIYTDNLLFSDKAESVMVLTDETREQMISEGGYKIEGNH